jgi:hypothetical protein
VGVPDGAAAAVVWNARQAAEGGSPHDAQPPGDRGVQASAYWPDPHGQWVQERTHSASAAGGHAIAPA